MKKRKLKLVLVLSASLLLFFTSLSVYTMAIRMKITVQETIANQSLEAAESIASNLDINTYKNFLSNPKVNEHYSDIKNYLNDAREKLGALYVYTLEINSPKEANTMVVGAAQNLDSIIGAPAIVPEDLIKRAYFEGESYVTDLIEDPKYGTYVSVGAPIKDEKGNVIGFLAIDTSVDTLHEIEAAVMENNIIIFLFCGFFIVVVIASFYLLQRWYLKEVGDTENTYQTEIKSLIASVSSLRHDFINHIQVIHGLLMIGETNKALHYVTSLSKEVQVIEAIKLNVEHPGLAILLQSKKLVAQNNLIDMDVKISPNAFDKIKTMDLIKIISNLIDNAIDAVNELPEGKREISINCYADDTKYVFKIINTTLQKLDNELVFTQGYSTKEAEPGKIRGQGLFIVQQIVHKYNGSILICSTDKGKVNAIVEIPLK